MGNTVVTLGDAERLFEEKVERLQTEMGQAQRAAQASISVRDKALQEVTTLQQEKDRLINELAQAKQDKQRILDATEQSRKNVEASLAKQEAKANEVINRAAEIEAAAKESQRRAQQLRSQVDGIKQTLLAEVSALEADANLVIKKVRDALAGIPDAPKS